MDPMDVDPSSSADLPRRGRSGTVIGSSSRNDEDFNEPGLRRRELLEQMHQILGQRPVPRPFWAVLMFCDVDMLAKLVCEAEKSPYLLEFCMHSCAALPLVWKQKEPLPPRSSASSNSSSQTSGKGRKQVLIDRVNERDNSSCVIRKSTPSQVAHIYPHYLIAAGQTKKKTNFCRTFPPFWDVLKFFWTPDRLAKWHREIFTNADNPERPYDSIQNSLCLSADAHTMWNNGTFVLKPLGYNEGKTELQLEFHWQPAPTGSIDENVPVNTIPASSRGLHQVEHPGSTQRSNLSVCEGEFAKVIKTGDLITITTSDANRLPLPSMELLDMQFVLSRIVNLSGAGKVSELIDSHSSEDDEKQPVQIEDWLGATEQLSEDSDSDDSGDQPVSEDTSAHPSPLKTRTAMEAAGQNLFTDLEQSVFLAEHDE